MSIEALQPKLGAELSATSTSRRVRSRWVTFIFGRLMSALAVLISLVIATFLIVHLVPGDPARNLLGLGATAGDIARVRTELGLSQSLPHQFASYVWRLLMGDLGTSFVTQQPVTELLGQRLPATAKLAGSALGVVVLLSFPLGMVAARLQSSGRRRWVNPSFSVGTSFGGAMPEYITGTLLIYVFALLLHLLPAQGGVGVKGFILPVIAVAFAPTAILARLVRNETLAVLSREYIVAAGGKRLSGMRLYLRHVLPNVVTSTLTLSGLLLVALLGGTVITENVFGIPGLGTEIVQSILQSDYPAIQGIILTLGAIAIVINLCVDVLLGVLDPRTLSGNAL